MRILMLALGTRGDLQLLSSFGERLAERGHAVTFASWRDYLIQLGETRLTLQPVGRGTADDGRRLLVELAGERDLSLRSRQFMERWIQPELRAARPVLETLARSSDYFVSNLSIAFAHGAERLPAATVLYDPPEDPPRWCAWLESLDTRQLLPLVALPSEALPREAGPVARAACTGWWQTDASATPALEDATLDFLARSPRTFVLTLGSMPTRDPSQLFDALATGLRAVDGQLLWAGGWSERPAMEPWPPEIHWVREANYATLLPRVRGILHHGGYGTIVASLRAGIPATVLPQLGVQRVFGHWLQERGLAVDTIEPPEVGAKRLTAALRAMDGMRDTASALSETGCPLSACARAMAKDNGMERAVDALERHAVSLGISSARPQDASEPREERP